jgi:predicted glutamine amidotransferase
MCGILGMIQVEPEDGHAEERRMLFDRLLVASEARGDDATGVATVIDGEFKHLKNPYPANVFAATDDYQNFEFGRIVIGHTRAQTQGAASDNENNHPFITDRLAVVHNGMIQNDMVLIHEEKLKPKGKCDSEVIGLMIEKIWRKNAIKAIVNAVAQIRGSMSVLMLDKDSNLYAFRDSNPMVLAVVPSLHCIFIASNEDYFREIFSPGFDFLGLYWAPAADRPSYEYHVTELPNEAGMRLSFNDADKLIAKHFEVKSKTYTVVNNTGRQSWAGRKPVSGYPYDDDGWDPNGDAGGGRFPTRPGITSLHGSSNTPSQLALPGRANPVHIPVTGNRSRNWTLADKTSDVKQVKKFLKFYQLPRTPDWFEFMAMNYNTLEEARLDLDTLRQFSHEGKRPR